MKNLINRSVSDSLIFRLLLLVTAVGICTYYGIKGSTPYLLIFLVLAVFLFIRVISLYNNSIKKIKYMFDAIDNNDFSFQYAISRRSSDDRQVNELMNRIIRTMLQSKIDALKKETFYEQIIDSINIGIFVVDQNGYVLQKNKKALSLLGLSVFTHIKHIRNVHEKLAQHLESIKPGDKFNLPYTNERTTMNLSVRVSGAELKNKPVSVVTFNDINHELDEKELDSWIRLTRVMTHEIMNSITPITSISDTLLSMKDFTEKEVHNGLEVISKTGKGLVSFVESYRKFTQIPPPHPTLFYVKNFVERMVMLSSHNNKYPNIKWQTNIEPADLILHADENLISLVMINLLKNARQAIGHKKEGTITVNVSCNALESITIEVSNNGPVIPEEEASLIFTPFFTTKKDGSGIGLSVARQIMRLSGGNITLNSNFHTGITTFTLTFP
ncbi:MAG: PAS domain-containing protein [Tannerella sp.]|nr:PAS domain-containing protein [Tannerella sp.]